MNTIGSGDCMNGEYPASDWVRRHIAGIPERGCVLDVACGKGRHLRLAHALGHPIVGIDVKMAGVGDLLEQPGIELVEADLETGEPFPLSGRQFSGVIVTNYLWRPILPALVDCVADDGLLIYETFAQGNQKYGRPTNPDYLLRPGELLSVVQPRLMPIAFEHIALRDPSRAVQRIVAVGPRHGWLADPPSLART